MIHGTPEPDTDLSIARRSGAADGNGDRTLEPRDAPGAAACPGRSVLRRRSRGGAAAAVPFVLREEKKKTHITALYGSF